MFSDNQVRYEDVLSGRGERCNVHNSHNYKPLIEQNVVEYSRVQGRTRKHQVAERVVDEIRGIGGRFLIQAGPSNTNWRVASDKEATDKIKQAFRDERSRRSNDPRPMEIVINEESSENAGTLLQVLQQEEAHHDNTEVPRNEKRNGGENMSDALIEPSDLSISSEDYKYWLEPLLQEDDEEVNGRPPDNELSESDLSSLKQPCDIRDSDIDDMPLDFRVFRRRA